MDTTPGPLFPSLFNKPLPLEENEKTTYLLSIKQSLRNSMRGSVFYVESKEADKTYAIERYSDKYKKLKTSAKGEWQPDWNILPKELKYYYFKDDESKKKKKKKIRKCAKLPITSAAAVKSDLLLDEVEKPENEGDEEEELDTEGAAGVATAVARKDKDDEAEKKSEKENNESDNELENEDDEDLEEDNDYIDTYFDNGDDYADDDGGDGDDGGGGTY